MQKIIAMMFILALTACSGASASSAKSDSSESENSMSNTLYITVDGVKMSATLVDNSSTRALLAKLAGGPIIYYDTNQWDFTPMGKVNDKTQAELKTILKAGEGSVSITLSLE